MDILEGPTDCITFLGIELDTRAGVMRLPVDKLSRLKSAHRVVGTEIVLAPTVGVLDCHLAARLPSGETWEVVPQAGH